MGVAGVGTTCNGLADVRQAARRFAKLLNQKTAQKRVIENLAETERQENLPAVAVFIYLCGLQVEPPTRIYAGSKFTYAFSKKRENC